MHNTTRIRPGRWALPVLATALALTPIAARAGTGFKLVAKYAVADDGRWDYITIDAAGHRLFVSHGDAVDVIDAATGRSLTPSVVLVMGK